MTYKSICSLKCGSIKKIFHEHRWHQSMVKTKKWQTGHSQVCHWCSDHLLTTSITEHTHSDMESICFIWILGQQNYVNLISLRSNLLFSLLNQPYNSYNVSSENLVLDQLIIPKLIFSLFSSLVCLILYWYCKEKFFLGHSCELKG